jgi:hypothetical protein
LTLEKNQLKKYLEQEYAGTAHVIRGRTIQFIDYWVDGNLYRELIVGHLRSTAMISASVHRTDSTEYAGPLYLRSWQDCYQEAEVTLSLHYSL